MANVSSSNGLEKRPKLRVPGFDEPIKSAHLSQYLDENKERNRKLIYTKSDVLSVSGEYGIINQIEFQGRSFAGESVAEYHVVETNDIVYTKSPLKANPYGIIKVNNGAPGIVSTLYAVYHPCEGTVAEYIDYYFGNDLRLNKYLKPLVNIGAKHDMKVNNETVLTGEVYFPGYSEQKKIVGFLTILDERIRQQRNLVEALKKYKRGLLSHLFSEKSTQRCTTKRYYFSEIAQRRSEKYDPSSGIEYPCVELENIEQESGKILATVPSIKQGSIKNIARPGDTLFGKLRPYLRKYAFAEQMMVCSSEIWTLIPSDVVLPKFLFYLTQTEQFLQVANISSGTKMPRAEWSNIEKAEFFIPDFSVQHKAVSLLERVDKKITYTDSVLIYLKGLKTGLMQKLFI